MTIAFKIIMSDGQENYEEKFVNHVRRLPVISSNEIFNMHKSEVTIKYSDEKEFTRLAKQIGLMPDTKVRAKQV